MKRVQVSIPAAMAEDVIARVQEFERRTAEAEAKRQRIERASHGTLFVARRSSFCPMDRAEIDPGDRAVMMDNYDPRTGRAASDAYCLGCARARGWYGF